ncbi:hypothetical protein WCD74_27090 [Actinomycetospora sp. OC33-EN08]|uniref:DUF6985 domain-containing protein n=1 Tax=Actinomycetospora aurantiaca TaxID=3129233 RepID=A0ABU8MWY6_9PSEU
MTDRLAGIAAQVADLLDRAEPEDHATPEQRHVCREAVAAVRAGGANLLDTATPYLWEYYRDLADAVGEDELGMTPLRDGDDIWEHVELPRVPTLVLGGDERAPSPCYVNFEGEVRWEPEHGLQLVFDHTGRLARVGPYTGHVTVARVRGSADLDTIYG